MSANTKLPKFESSVIRFDANCKLGWIIVRRAQKVLAVSICLSAMAGWLLAEAAEGQLKNESVTANGGLSRDLIENSINMRFVRIGPGVFLMGSPAEEPGRFVQEGQFEVEISESFYLGVTEVTVGQFKQVMRRSLSQGKDEWAETNVSWHDADDFCRQLSNLPDEKNANRRYRLPTEAEWEYACRAGSQAAYCFGSEETELVEFAWMFDSATKTRMPVASLRPNAWGFFDMHGGVWEWCGDWFSEYPSTGVIDPVGPLRGDLRVLRGGCHESPASYCRSAMRMPYDPARTGVNNIGVRVVLELSSRD